MADTIPVPTVDQGVPAPWSDAKGFVMSGLLLVLGIMVLIGATGLAQTIYNRFVAANTPDQIGQVEVV